MGSHPSLTVLSAHCQIKLNFVRFDHIPMISLVIPVFNEEKVLPELFRRLKEVTDAIGPHEVVFVDDGSRDATAAMITRKIQEQGAGSSMKLLSFSRNFGHQIALSAGLDHVSGDAVAVLDADLQDPPELIQKLMVEWKAGADIVYAVRRKRKESLPKRMAYSLFYRILQSLSSVAIPLDSGDFCLMDRKVVDVLRAMPERTRFLRGMRAWAGFKSVGVEYEREARFAGETKYSVRKLIRLAMDGIMSFSTVPLKLSTYVGFFIAFCSVLAAILVLVLKLIGVAIPQGWSSLMISIFFIGGVQLFVLGIMGEYIGRIYTEVQQRPLYIIRQKIGF